jgi:Galactose oxidase, central domain
LLLLAPQAVGSWETFTPNYPLNSPEAQSDLIGGDMVSTGGFNGAFNAVTKRTYARTINVVNSSWRRMDDMSAAIGITHAATAIIGMKMYMCGGYEGPPPGPHVDYCFVYDHSKAPGTQWSDFTPLPNGGSAGGGMIYDEASNALFYSGGAQRPNLGSNVAIDQDNTWKFCFDDPSSGWVASTPIPYKANHQSHLTVNFQGGQRHFFAGGQMAQNEAGGNVADVFEFVPSSETWIRRKSMPYGRGHTSTSTRAYGCGFLIAGGAINGKSLTRTSDIHYYHIPSNTWTLIASLPVKKATPKVFMDEENDYLYFVDNSNTSRLKLTKS